MHRGIMATLVMVGLSLCWPAVADEAGLSGVWRGPWYRGMTSGVVTIELAADGSGTIRFTNLENFGEAPVALDDIKRKERSIEFSATGSGGIPFTAVATLTPDGRRLLGNARYEGYGVRFEARTQK
jgi:hypothetical protein